MSFVENELAALRQGHARGMVTDEETSQRMEELERLLWHQVLDRVHRVHGVAPSGRAPVADAEVA
jgi:hypothetical protein